MNLHRFLHAIGLTENTGGFNYSLRLVGVKALTPDFAFVTLANEFVGVSIYTFSLLLHCRCSIDIQQIAYCFQRLMTNVYKFACCLL